MAFPIAQPNLLQRTASYHAGSPERLPYALANDRQLRAIDPDTIAPKSPSSLTSGKRSARLSPNTRPAAAGAIWHIRAAKSTSTSLRRKTALKVTAARTRETVASFRAVLHYFGQAGQNSAAMRPPRYESLPRPSPQSRSAAASGSPRVRSPA